MALADEIERLRAYPAGASDEFRGQIDRVRELRERLNWSSAPSRDLGVDRSTELSPILRPAILRSVAND